MVRWKAAVLALSLFALAPAQMPQRSPYETHPHYVWGLSPSFFERHLHHSDAEIVDNAINLMWSIGDFCWHEGYHFQLIRIAKACTELDPTFGEAYEGAVWLLGSYGRDEEALKLLKSYLKHNPNRYEPYYELGWFYHQRRRYEEAVPWLEKAVQFPHPPIIEHTLAHAYERSGRPKDALRVWENKLKRFSDDLVAKRHYERLKKLLEQRL